MSTPYAPTHVHPRPPAVNPQYITKVLASAGPEQVTNERRIANVINVSGFKDATTANTDDIYVGLGPDYQPWKVPAGYTVPIEAERGGFPIALSDLYIRGTSGDGVIVEFAEGAKI